MRTFWPGGVERGISLGLEMSSRGQPTVLADRYELGEVLGRGGMAEVRLARDRRLGRTVAVKMMRADLVDRADFVARFGKEARSVAALNHPTVVAVYDSGEARSPRVDGTDVVPYIVMEYVTGRTLGQLIDEGPVPLGQALSVTADVLTALEHAHAAGIVHRDIKPSNVMLTPTGAAKVMDFGIARVLSDATMTTTVVATPHYVSPEHAHGLRVDARSDLYSVGCMLFELLTGRPPFVAETSLAVVLQHLNEPPPQPSAVRPGVPPVLDRVMTKALAKERDDRYQTAAQFRDDLEAVVRGQEPPVAGPGPAGPTLAATALVASTPPEPPPVAGPVFEPPAAVVDRLRSDVSSFQPTVTDPALGPTTPQAPHGLPDRADRRVVPDRADRRVMPDRADAPVGVDQPRRVGVGWLVGALVLVVVVACAAWWWPRGGAAPQTSPTGAAQAGPQGRPTPVSPADPADSNPEDPSDQSASGTGQPAGPGRDGGEISLDDLKDWLVPPNAGAPATQERSIGNQAVSSLTYQSRDTVENLAGYYQNVLADTGTYFDQDTSDGEWFAHASSGGWTITVTLTEQRSGTTVLVTLTGTE